MDSTERVRDELLAEGQLLRLVLSAPKGNILDTTLIEGLCRALERHDTPRLKAIVFEGEGAHFSFGASVAEHEREPRSRHVGHVPRPVSQAPRHGRPDPRRRARAVQGGRPRAGRVLLLDLCQSRRLPRTARDQARRLSPARVRAPALAPRRGSGPRSVRVRALAERGRGAGHGARVRGLRRPRRSGARLRRSRAAAGLRVFPALRRARSARAASRGCSTRPCRPSSASIWRS
jgi:hypothetical protein